MVTLDIELQTLKDHLLEMMDLVNAQLHKCKTALEENNQEAADQVVDREKRVNSLELLIDKECEHILALHNPVATDLRFVLSTLRICADLESIGDIAKSLAKTARNHIKKEHKGMLDKFQILKMLEICTAMLNDMREAVEKEDARLGEKMVDKDKALNEINKEAAKTASDLIKDNTKEIEFILKLFTVTRKLERVGDFIKNIGAELVFHIEARVLKHKHV